MEADTRFGGTAILGILGILAPSGADGPADTRSMSSLRTQSVGGHLTADGSMGGACGEPAADVGRAVKVQTFRSDLRYNPPMRVGLFLDRFVQGYLFSDLETMKYAGAPSGDGRLGYPMFTGCAAGIELLGFLISDGSIVKPKPWQNFVRYWETYLYPGDPARRGAGMSVLQLIRNGIAHTFTSKAPTIAKEGPHLVNIDGVARVNVVELAEDLCRTYYSDLRPVVDGKQIGRIGETTVSIQRRLDELMATHEANLNTHSAGLIPLPCGKSALDGLNAGATEDVKAVELLLPNSAPDPPDLSSNSTYTYTMKIRRE
jgi:hypothetical protein